MRRNGSVVWLFSCALACSANPPEPTAEPQPGSDAERAVASITAQDMYDRIAFLASDSMGGRDTPSPGLEAAAGYVTDQYRVFGLRPAGDSGTFLQYWPYREQRLDVASTSLSLTVQDTTAQMQLGVHYFVIPGRTPAASAELYFSGTTETGRSAGTTATQIPVWFVPGRMPDSAWNARIGAALSAGMSAGAPAVALVLDSAFDAALFRQIATAVGVQQASLHVIGLRWAAVAELFRKAGLDIADARATPGMSRALDQTRLSLNIGRSTNERRAPNVVGVLTGSDPILRDEFVVLSAHIDHVGIGQPDESGDSIYNGADDNASGVAAVLEVAQALAAMRNRPARSILFLTMSGEEKGLLGSRYFVENLPVPVDRIVANINLEMVGRNAPDTLVAIGMEYTTLGALAAQIAAAQPALGLVVANDPWPEERLFFRSGHFHFARAGIPAIFFTTGLHPQYHRPSDEVELIDRDKLARIGQLVFQLILEIATRSERPAWTDEGLAVIGNAEGH